MNDETDWVNLNLLNFEDGIESLDFFDVATEFPEATSKVDSWMEKLEECLRKDNGDDNSRSSVDYFNQFDLEMCDLGIIDHLESGERPPSSEPEAINGVSPDFVSNCEIDNDLFLMLGNAGCDDGKTSPNFESNCENDKTSPNFESNCENDKTSPNFDPNLEFLGNGGCDSGKNSPNFESNSENDKNSPNFDQNLEFLGNGGCDSGKNSPNFESNSENDKTSPNFDPNLEFLGNGGCDSGKNSPNFESNSENDKNSPNFDPNLEFLGNGGCDSGKNSPNSENDKNSPNFDPNCENEKSSDDVVEVNDDEDVNGDDPDSMKRKRQLRNRDAAMRSRERKKILVKDLEMKSRYFEEECRRLQRLLHCCYAENQWLRSLQTYGAPMTKPESAVLLLESLLLGSLVWLMVNICLFPQFKLPLSNQDAALLVSVVRKLLESAVPRGKGTNISELWTTLSFTRSKRCKASRTKMKSHSSLLYF